MEIQVVKWGNGQGIRIPKLILQELKFKHRTLEERARAYDGKLGPYTEFDWGEPKGREVW